MTAIIIIEIKLSKEISNWKRINKVLAKDRLTLLKTSISQMVVLHIFLAVRLKFLVLIGVLRSDLHLLKTRNWLFKY